MDARATRMGSGTLGYTAPRSANLTPSQPDAMWGQVPQGIKTIIKIAVVAVVAYAAISFLLPGVAYTIGSVVAGIGSSVLGGLNATLAFFGISTAAAGIGTAATAGTVSLGASTAAAAIGLSTATMTPAAKTASLSTAALATPVAPAPSVVPDLSNSVASIDPSTILAKKSALASNAAMAIDVPDMPVDHLADHSHLHTDNAKMASKLGQEAIEIRDHAHRHAASTRDHISQIENKVSQWSDRVGGKKPEAAPLAHQAESLQKRDSSFATELNTERSRLDQALAGPSV